MRLVLFLLLPLAIIGSQWVTKVPSFTRMSNLVGMMPLTAPHTNTMNVRFAFESGYIYDYDFELNTFATYFTADNPFKLSLPLFSFAGIEDHKSFFVGTSDGAIYMKDLRNNAIKPLITQKWWTGTNEWINYFLVHSDDGIFELYFACTSGQVFNLNIPQNTSKIINPGKTGVRISSLLFTDFIANADRSDTNKYLFVGYANGTILKVTTKSGSASTSQVFTPTDRQIYAMMTYRSREGRNWLIAGSSGVFIYDVYNSSLLYQFTQTVGSYVDSFTIYCDRNLDDFVIFSTRNGYIYKLDLNITKNPTPILIRSPSTQSDLTVGLLSNWIPQEDPDEGEIPVLIISTFSGTVMALLDNETEWRIIGTPSELNASTANPISATHILKTGVDLQYGEDLNQLVVTMRSGQVLQFQSDYDWNFLKAHPLADTQTFKRTLKAYTPEMLSKQNITTEWIRILQSHYFMRNKRFLMLTEHDLLLTTQGLVDDFSKVDLIFKMTQDTLTQGPLSFSQIQSTVYLENPVTIQLKSSTTTQTLTYIIIGFEHSSDDKRFDSQSVILIDESQHKLTIPYDSLFRYPKYGLIFAWKTSLFAAPHRKISLKKKILY